MRRSSLFFLLVMVALSFIGIACTENRTGNSPHYGNQLYRKSVVLVKQYMSKIEAAPDSASIDSLFACYRDAVDSLNYSFPPDTDLRLSEGQNDTLILYSKRIVELYRKKLSMKAATDSLSFATDSL